MFVTACVIHVRVHPHVVSYMRQFVFDWVYAYIETIAMLPNEKERKVKIENPDKLVSADNDGRNETRQTHHMRVQAVPNAVSSKRSRHSTNNTNKW